MNVGSRPHPTTKRPGRKRQNAHEYTLGFWPGGWWLSHVWGHDFANIEEQWCAPGYVIVWMHTKAWITLVSALERVLKMHSLFSSRCAARVWNGMHRWHTSSDIVHFFRITIQARFYSHPVRREVALGTFFACKQRPLTHLLLQLTCHCLILHARVWGPNSSK